MLWLRGDDGEQGQENRVDPSAWRLPQSEVLPDLGYRTYVEKASPDVAANTIICLVHQANYLLDQLLRQLEQQFVSEVGFTEKLYRVRQEARKKQ